VIDLFSWFFGASFGLVSGMLIVVLLWFHHNKLLNEALRSLETDMNDILNGIKEDEKDD